MKYTNKLKKALSVFLCTALVGSTAVALPSVISDSGIVASAAGTYGNYQYELQSDGTVQITNYTGSETSVMLPSSINGKDVTSVSRYAFKGNTTIKSISLPGTFTTVPSQAFYGCYALETITLPDTVTEIGTYAFEFCDKLTTVNVRGKLKKIYLGAFYSCYSLSNFKFGNDLISVGNSAFINTGLKSATLPDSVTSLGDHSFGFTYKNSEFIAVDGFVLNGKKGSVVETYAKNYNITFKRTDTPTFEEDCELREVAGGLEIVKYSGELKSITIPSEINGKTVVAIADEAFADNEDLERVFVPGTIKSWGDYVFYGCTALKTAVIYSGPENIGECTFMNCSSLTLVSLPDTLTSFSRGVLSDCTSLKNIDIPETVTSIGNEVFYGCTALEDINLPEGLTGIGKEAFTGCTSLSNISLPYGLTLIDEDAFSGCTGLYSISIPVGVTKLGRGAFSYIGLTAAYIPESVTDIGDYCFEDNNDLTIYGIAGSAAQTYAEENGIPFSSEDLIKYSDNGDGTLRITGCTPIYSTLVIPETINGKTVTIIDNSAFYYHSELRKVVLHSPTVQISQR